MTEQNQCPPEVISLISFFKKISTSTFLYYKDHAHLE